VRFACAFLLCLLNKLSLFPGTIHFASIASPDAKGIVVVFDVPPYLTVVIVQVSAQRLGLNQEAPIE
jgi:hypothetical protein